MKVRGNASIDSIGLNMLLHNPAGQTGDSIP